MTDDSADGTPFRVGRALSRSFSIYFRNIVPFGLLALVILAPIYVYQILVGPDEFAAAPGTPEYWQQFSVEPLVVFAVDFLLSNLVMAALVYGTIQNLKGEDTSFGECFAKGIALMLPAFGVGVVYLLVLVLATLAVAVPCGIVLGLLVYATDATVIYFLGVPVVLVPFLYVAVVLYVTLPVAVIERAGIGSLKRSAALTNGHRWRLFALLILFVCIGGAVGAALYLLGLTGESSSNFTGGMVTQWGLSGVISAFSAVMTAVIYHDLRVAKEGVDSDQIAAVFD